jgi:hypothetical protein
MASVELVTTADYIIAGLKVRQTSDDSKRATRVLHFLTHQHCLFLLLLLRPLPLTCHCVLREPRTICEMPSDENEPAAPQH